ncbi:MAG TPA: hypothetical protein VK720_02655 [Terracidiphilus sp.]|jgi:ElaB/YqjD/DUF883 family membrane-anchored ribosome-binding protein|nr:hypothetical protein [Terracidiphilus sp.]
MDLLEKQAATVEELLREVSKIKSVVKDAVDDGVKSALKTVKQSRDAAEDAIDDAKRAVKQNPLEAVGIVFVAGVLFGCLATWVGTRRS